MSRVFGNHPRRAWGLPALLIIALIATSCAGGREVPKPMQIKILKGSARLFREEVPSIVRSQAGVRAGDRIVQSRDGIAELYLAAGRLFEIAGADLRVVSPTKVTLDRGNALASLAARASVDGREIEISSAKGAFRVDRSLATRVGVYEGQARVESDGEELSVPRLRQATIAGGVVPRAPKPLRIDAGDPWDRRFLQEALDLDVRLTGFGRGLEAQLGTGSGVAFFARILPVGGDLGFLVPFVGLRRSDVLIALALSLEAAKSPESVSGRFTQIYALWSDGATWGLIAYELGVGQPSVFARLLDAVRLAGVTIGAGPVVPPRTSPPPAAPSPPPPPPPPPGPGNGGNDGDNSTPIEKIQETIDDVIGLLPLPVPSPLTQDH